MKLAQRYIFFLIFLPVALGVAGRGVVFSQLPPIADTLKAVDTLPKADTLPGTDTITRIDTLPKTDTLVRDTAKTKPFLTAPLTGKAQDSLVLDMSRAAGKGRVKIYQKGEVTYGDMNIHGDRIEYDLNTGDIDMKGAPMIDSANRMSRPTFAQGGQDYQMDSMRYNLDSKRGIVFHSTTKQGEGYMIAGMAKMHEDKTIDARSGQYTTCNHLDHPHFYIAMTKGRVIPNKKVIFGTAYFVLEDVPLYFPFIPFGFFPLMQGPTSGFIMPSFGEEYSKGFFLRDGGYYFKLSDYVDAQVTGSIYTLGSWGGRLSSRYMRRYKYSGNMSFDYANNVIGEKGSADYLPSAKTYSLRWSHQQDPKFRPGTTFSASVNFTSSGYSRYTATTLQDMMSTQTNSSIAYTKNWRAGRGFPGANVALSFNHSQNSRDSTIMFTFPNASWSVPKFKPFKRREAAGKERWYEKLSASYSGRMQGSVTTKEKYLFKQQMFDGYRSGVAHTVPVSVAWTILDYINFTPNATYNENWYFQKVDKRWDEGMKQLVSDTTGGFYRAWDYSLSASMGTKVYGMFLMKNTAGALKAVRHVLTPTASFTFRPDATMKYRKVVQSSLDGGTTTYSPYDGQMYGVPGGAKQMAVSFGLTQNLEAKIRDGDTTRVIKIVDNLSITSSYNFVAESFKLSNFSVNFSTPIYKQYSLKFNAEFDPYMLDARGTRIDRYTWKERKMPRLTRFSTSFGWQLNKTMGSGQPINDTGTLPIMRTDAELEMLDPQARADAEAERRRLLGGTYYDFAIPYNLSLNYNFSYSKPGRVSNISQTIGFGGSVTLTPYQSDGTNRWGLTFQGGYDIQMRKPTLGNIAIVRDLHCFTMSLNWMPVGMHRSWSFNIRVKASVLKDLKYDKSRSQYDTMFD